MSSISNKYYQVEYFDLAINIEKSLEKLKTFALEFHKLQSNFATSEVGYCHTLHTKDREFNSLVDLLINFSEN